MTQRAESRFANIQAIYFRQCEFLVRRYPELRDLGLPVSAQTARQIFDIYCWQVKRIDSVAGAQDFVKFYEQLLAQTNDAPLRQVVVDKLVDLQIARGMPHKALPFLAADDPNRKSIGALGDEHAAHYGYDLRRFDLTKIDRGDSLRFYFSNNTEILSGKRVLHVAPEARLRPWMREASSEVGFYYTTADGFAEDVDHYIDLCALPFPDGHFDIIIIHRVLEHVIDNATALHELQRVLQPGGILNISVPEQLYLPRTADWRVPDPRAHMHFRIYGRDFPAMLMKAGFLAERCDWLLKQSVSMLASFDAYPMLFYNAVKAED